MGSYTTTKAWREAFKLRDPEGFKAYRATEAKKWRLAHPDVSKKIAQRHREKNINAIRVRDAEAQRKFRKNNPEAQRERMRRFKEKYRHLQEEKAGRPRSTFCELCGDITKTVFDHDHATDIFRGWLCDRCNRVLGSVQDNPDLLRKMIKYLETHNGEVKLQNQEEPANINFCYTQ